MTHPGLLLVLLSYVGFVSLGLPDAVLGVAWPGVRDRFAVPQSAAGLVFVASGAGYLLSSVFAGRLTHRLGIGLLLATSTGLVAVAMLGFAAAPAWPLFVACGVAHGLGSGAIDAGLNSFAAHRLSARHMSWLHACYCLGAMLGPLLMTAVLAGGRPYPVGYAAVGGVMLLLGVVFLFTRPRWGRAMPEASGPPAAVREVLRHPTVRLQMLVFFLYTGLEATFSQWAYTVLTERKAVAAELAGVAAGLYWLSIGLGRVAAGLLADRVGVDRLLRWGLAAAVVGALLFAGLPGEAAVGGLLLAGLGLAPVFPGLMTRTPERLPPELSGHAVGLQVGAAMVGAAAVPGALGLLGLATLPAGAAGLAAGLWLLHERLVRLGLGERPV